MKIKEIEAFDAYMKYGTMKAAAEELGISQPMMSRLLSNLEKYVEFKLFNRKRNQLEPTPEAYLYHSSVLRMMAGIIDTRKDAEAIANNQLGNIVIASQPTFCDTILLDVIKRFKAQHLDVGVRMLDVGLQELLKMIDKNTCDVALGITLEADNYSANVTPLAKCEARCIMHRTHPLAKEHIIPIQRLKNERFIDLMPDSPIRRRVDRLMQSIGANRNTVAEIRTMRGVCALVDRGVGVAIIDPVAELLLQGTSVISKPITPSIDWELAFLTSANRPTSRVSQSFFEHLKAEINRLKEMRILHD
tara:strand:- start:1519 stop:2430 length:912 start_codon:yes stop_codon:yes gene_type:complete